MHKVIEGVLPIASTPFLEDDKIDYDSYQKEIDWIFELGCNGFGLAMVSEILRLTTEERVELTFRLAEMNNDRGVFFVNVGAESSKQALFYAKEAEKAGCDAIMAIPPVASALPDQALAGYFETLAENVDLPLIVQDASGYVGQPMTVEFQASLLKMYGSDKILFKPEASPLGPILSDLRDQTNGQARIFEGSGGILLVDTYRRGINGTMPGCDLLDGVVALWKALKSDNDELVYPLYFPISAIVALQMQAGLDGFVAIEKYILVKRQIFTSDRRRMPYTWSLDEETQAEVDRLLENLKRAIQIQ